MKARCQAQANDEGWSRVPGIYLTAVVPAFPRTNEGYQINKTKFFQSIFQPGPNYHTEPPVIKWMALVAWRVDPRVERGGRPPAARGHAAQQHAAPPAHHCRTRSPVQNKSSINVLPSNAHISTPFFQKTVFLKYVLETPPQNFWRYV